MSVQKLHKIYIYSEGITHVLNLGEIAGYMKERLRGIGIERREGPFFSIQGEISHYAKELSGIKIQDAARKIMFDQEPLFGEIEYEKRRLMGKTNAFGVLYDGLLLKNIFWHLIPKTERDLKFAHIIFTNRLFATWDEQDKRYHARVSVYGLPSIISTSGLVEAPAKPREYYLLKRQYEMLRRDPFEAKDKFEGRFIDYEDKRLTEVMKGYAMQAVFCTLAGDPFCEDKGCRLFNAHWQEELIHAQLESDYEFCPKHAQMMDKLVGSSASSLKECE